VIDFFQLFLLPVLLLVFLLSALSLLRSVLCDSLHWQQTLNIYYIACGSLGLGRLRVLAGLRIDDEKAARDGEEEGGERPFLMPQ
jgi:hypothetical protein